MKKKYIKGSLGLCVVLPCIAVAAETQTPRLPNIVWFLTEDLSPQYLRLYNNNESGAFTPNVQQLAREGIVFNNAYSNAPVSSAARTTLITGCYAPRFAGSFHRKLLAMNLPEEYHMFPTYLRRAGYYTSNCVKTDYNCKLDTEAWDEIHSKIGDWRNRKNKNQPFFFMRSNVETHESRLHFPLKAMENKPTVYNPEAAFIHPYLQDTKLMRYTYATIYDRIADSDAELGEIISMLREDGEMDNTFIFYFGDNGGTLPGTKGYTSDLGLHVPLVVYVPPLWRDKIGIPTHSIHDGLVSFMDFGPTLLHLAGIDVPEYMDGKPFLGKDVGHGRESVMGYGDRFDELYAFNRSICKGDWRYARNYLPYHPKSVYAFYRYKMEAFKQWADFYKKGKLNEIQSRFFEPQGCEELYNLKEDPNEMVNLALNDEFKDKLKELRSELTNYVVEHSDLGFYPETILLEEGIDNLVAYGQKNKDRIARYSEIADWELMKYSEIHKDLYKALSSKDAVERWWALTVCSSYGNQAVGLQKKLTKLLKDKRSFVSSRALVALLRIGVEVPQEELYRILRNSKTGAESLLVLNDYTYLVESGYLKPFVLEEDQVPEKCNGVDWRITYLNKLAQ